MTKYISPEINRYALSKSIQPQKQHFVLQYNVAQVPHSSKVGLPCANPQDAASVFFFWSEAPQEVPIKGLKRITNFNRTSNTLHHICQIIARNTITFIIFFTSMDVTNFEWSNINYIWIHHLHHFYQHQAQHASLPIVKIVVSVDLLSENNNCFTIVDKI